MAKVIAVNYNFTPDWIPLFTSDYLIFDRSDSPDYTRNLDPNKVVKTANVGNVDLDKLHYLVDNYDNLPETFLWIKTNLFKYITEEEFNQLKDRKEFTPLLTQNHLCYTDEQGWVNYYEDGIYHERNNSWYLNIVPPKYVETFDDWAKIHGLPQGLAYIPFAPGGNFILTREDVHRYSRDYYENMASMLDWTQTPGEAQCAERSYYLMWR